MDIPEYILTITCMPQWSRLLTGDMIFVLRRSGNHVWIIYETWPVFYNVAGIREVHEMLGPHHNTCTSPPYALLPSTCRGVNARSHAHNSEAPHFSLRKSPLPPATITSLPYWLLHAPIDIKSNYLSIITLFYFPLLSSLFRVMLFLFNGTLGAEFRG